MSNKTKAKRVGKKYHPKPINVLAIDNVLTGPHQLDASQQQDLIDYTNAAFYRLKTDAQPSHDDLMTVNGALEITARFAQVSCGGNESLFAQVEDALRCVKHCEMRKFLGDEAYRFNGDELRIVERALGYHDEIVLQVNCKQMREVVQFLKGYRYVPSLFGGVAA